MPNAIRAILAIILVASLTWSAGAQDNLLSPEAMKIIENAREVALEYTANLPNFICTETIRRSQLPSRSQKWKRLDTLAVDVAFSYQGERYKLLTINGKPTKKSFKEIGGMRSDAEFGSILQWIFQPESQTEFQSERPTDLRGRPTNVFSYRIEQARSKFEVNHMMFAFGGKVYVDRETNRVLKITAIASGLPANWPSFSQEVESGFVEISGQRFSLPLHSQTDAMTQDGNQFRNELEFGNYRKFSSEATLEF